VEAVYIRRSEGMLSYPGSANHWPHDPGKLLNTWD
jgi:hypothetical protein